MFEKLMMAAISYLFKTNNKKLGFWFRAHMAEIVDICYQGDEDVYPLVCNLANMMAKVDGGSWYTIKEIMIQNMIRENMSGIRVWDGVVYCETTQGQVSFHIFSDEIFDLAEQNNVIEEYEWAGEELQFQAPWLIWAAMQE